MTVQDETDTQDERGACEAITRVFSLLGKRWSGLIIVTLLAGPARFSELVRLVPGLSERMLAERLSELGASGLLERQVGNGPPVRVSYALTDRGQALRPALAALERWGQEQLLSAPTPAPDPELSSGQPGLNPCLAQTRTAEQIHSGGGQ